MDKNKKIIILLCFLIPVAVLVLLPNFQVKAPKRVSRGASASGEAARFDRRALSGLLSDEHGVQKIEVNRTWTERNPFDQSPLYAAVPSPAPETVPEPELVLTGVLWSGSRPSAIINERVVRVGDRIEGLAVKAITEGGVVLMDGDREKTLTMRQKF